MDDEQKTEQEPEQKPGWAERMVSAGEGMEKAGGSMESAGCSAMTFFVMLAIVAVLGLMIWAVSC
jgi:hypothetical protein